MDRALMEKAAKRVVHVELSGDDLAMIALACRIVVTEERGTHDLCRDLVKLEKKTTRLFNKILEDVSR